MRPPLAASQTKMSGTDVPVEVPAPLNLRRRKRRTSADPDSIESLAQEAQ